MADNATLSTISNLIKSMKTVLPLSVELTKQVKDGIWVLNFQDYSENDLY